MADVRQSPQSQEQPHASTDLQNLKKDLEGYREIILPFNKVLEWEKPHYPAILVGSITFIFSIVWYLEPSVLTSFSLLGVILCLVDFVVPTLSSYLFSSAEWTIVQERQFESICIRLLNARRHIINVKNALAILKRDKPRVYLLVMMGAFALMAWIGSLIDNLLLTYLLMVFLVLVPGLRKHGILQKLTSNIKEVVMRMIKGKEKANKTKTN
ncbi:hypothetical protein LSH36_205g03053 [Paralvinella palmiformis]|uniref:RETREG1-3/ARL6IP-like N-terminal reticulon-homology domain-containing protein n=1 Tax=Paralvinella palmiformis TaxID=53620 RepID=A0AAD9JPF4_9ANNE|nr:hypothetical protein LSH36_205g03053 [Paralvinella palmiformis]